MLLGIAAYLLAMIATMPAGVFLKNRPWRTGIAGTVWNGEVGVAGGSKVEWNWAPLRSLTSLAFAADWKATGPDTDLGGRGLMGFGSTVLDAVSGSAHASLLTALQPDLPFTCDLVMQVEFDRIAIGGSDQILDGKLTTDPGTCTPKVGGAPAAVPSLLLTAEKIGTSTRIRITPATQRRQTLIDATLSEGGQLSVRITDDGARVLPFVGMPAGATIAGEL
ncbi:type II secretion system protein N [Sphingomonas sp. LT1P40]|uniref:type II secretion system protein N n=1 Tax=Alteristakelama amylovorans TaxID=3096166 RepID=UPI002FC581F0